MKEFTTAQKQRLTELNADESLINSSFDDVKEREACFKQQEKLLVEANKDALFALRDGSRRPVQLEVETALVKWLTEKAGFTQVVTPIIIAKEHLAKMTIGDNHPLMQQVFWLDDKKCLRPMLAPNLYDEMRSLQKVWGNPVRIFEVGPCFRKESQGARHLNEFTMLNLVELGGVDDGQQMKRLKELAKEAMAALEIDNYVLTGDDSVVYGNEQVMDVEINGMEVASGAYGPHFLDEKWGIFDTWVGIGFGIERLAMMKEGYHNIKRVARSVKYLNGARLNI